MSKTVEVVKPACAKSETTGFVVIVVLVLCMWCIGVYGRARTESHLELESWQMNVFTDLNPKEQGLYTDLLVTADEISQIYIDEDSSWCNLNELIEDGLSPFIKDITWEQRGHMKWSYNHRKNEVIDEVFYTGISESPSKVGNFILSIHKDLDSVKDEVEQEIWYTKNSIKGVPKSFSDSNLISAGWKQLVDYKGEDEVIKIKGGL